MLPRMQRASIAILLLLAACRPDPATEQPDATAAPEPAPVEDVPVETPPAETPHAETPPVETPPAETPPPEPPKPYDFVVSFISPGDGTDAAAYDRLKAIVAKYKGVVQVRSNWGREGEHDECFTLGELSAAKKKEFIAKVTASMKKSKKVNVAENAQCQGTPEAAPEAAAPAAQ